MSCLTAHIGNEPLTFNSASRGPRTGHFDRVSKKHKYGFEKRSDEDDDNDNHHENYKDAIQKLPNARTDLDDQMGKTVMTAIERRRKELVVMKQEVTGCERLYLTKPSS